MAQRGLFDEFQYRVRGLPATAVFDEFHAIFYKGFAAGRRTQGWRKRQFSASVLMAFECGSVQKSLPVEGEDAKTGADHTDWLTIDHFNRHLGHAHALPGESGKAEAGRIIKHPREDCDRKAIHTVLPIEQEITEGDAHDQ